MKKLILPIAAALLLAWTPVRAAPPDLSKVSESLLMEGVTNLSVCMATDVAGIIKLVALAKEEQAEPGPTAKEDIPRMYRDAEMLNEAMKKYSKVTDTVIDSLIKLHHHTEADLEKTIEPIFIDAVADLKATLEPVSNYREFQEAFEPKLKHCNESLDKWADKIPSLNHSTNP